MKRVTNDTRRTEQRSNCWRNGVTLCAFSGLLLCFVLPTLADGPRPFPGSESESSSPPVAAEAEWAKPITRSAPTTLPSVSTPAPEPASKPAPAKTRLDDTIQPVSGVKTAEGRATPSDIGRATLSASPANSGVSLSGINPNEKVKQASFSPENLLETPLEDVIIEGNETIPTAPLLQKIESRPHRIASNAAIQRDVSHLMNTRWFYSVRPSFREGANGPILVFQVVEKPMLNSVSFKGNKKIKTGELEAQTGLRKGAVYDVAANRESVNRIKQLYKEKGFLFAEVTLEAGNQNEERDVVISIVEGPKPKIRQIKFEGNEFCSDGVLQTKISSRTLKLWLIQGEYDPDVIQNDVLALKQEYMSRGFFDVDVKSEERLSEDRAKVTVVYTINEGRRYSVDKVEVVGNEVIGRDLLLNDLKMTTGKPFNERFLKEDVQKMTDLYDAQGRLFAKVVPTPRFRPGEEALIDLVYEIDEDVPRYIGTLNVHIAGDYPHSKEELVRQQMNRFLKPGQLASASDLRMAKARVEGSGFWDKETPVVFDIVPNSGEDYWIKTTNRAQDSRLISQDDAALKSRTPEEIFDHLAPPIQFIDAPNEAENAQLDDYSPQLNPEIGVIDQAVGKPQLGVDSEPLPEVSRRQLRRPEANTTPHVGNAANAPAPLTENAQAPATIRVPDFKANETGTEPAVAPSEFVFRGQSMDGQNFRSQSLDAYAQPVPQNYLEGVSPQGNPFGDALTTPPPGFVDVNVDVAEGRTGRLMFGVGVNSDAGLVGSLVLQEDNFDIMRPPRSLADIINGQAWRGAGQSFRIEAVPGTEVSRYMASWSDPYFLRSDFSLGVNGFYYNRFYEAWTEERLGGRVNVGYVLNKYWSASASVRLENVDISNIPTIAPPPQLAAVKGSNFLSTAGVSLQYDARDNSFFPTRGNYANFNYEQGFGEFTYPRFEVSGGQFFTTYERPDGFGKHVLSFTGQLGFTGENTPVFEKFFAGGYSSFRGFYFRGVSPEVNGVKIGGDFLALGSAEYMIPITANDNIRTVVFTDFGTVEPDVSLDHFRMSAGFGFRLTIPAMGPAPLAFDFAWPITRQEEDRLRVFSFYVGFNR
ncbi:BamA/OMP85 family outer membrane protein [Planctomicrobium sp. SH668]|uniref:BamA/OMP85 family outer membrane protein n=1 Tax=Planctomicrobium sp. SH668 TaxID=3448126 RepID=UPI003F5C41E8